MTCHTLKMWAEAIYLFFYFCKKGYCVYFLYGIEPNFVLGISMCLLDKPRSKVELRWMLHPDMGQTIYISRQYTYST